MHLADSVAVIQQLDRDLLAIELVRSGIAHQEQLIHALPLVDPVTKTPVSKGEFKEIGAAIHIVDQVGIEAVIGLAANAIETFSIRLARHMQTEWEPFKKPMDQVRFADRPRQIRALNNVFKHQEGYIDVAASKSAKYLVDAGLFSNGTYLKHLPAEAILEDSELALSEAFAHMYEVAFLVAALDFRHATKTGGELVQTLREWAVYPVINPTLARG
jgi:hypothetical protein